MEKQTIIWIVIAFQVVCAGFSAWLAENKGQRGDIWFFLGLFFGFIALIAIAGAQPIPPREEAEEEDEAEVGAETEVQE